MATLPPTPVSSAVAHDNRLTPRLNLAGTEARNPIIGSSHEPLTPVTPIPGGFQFQLFFQAVDASEIVDGSSIRVIDDSGDTLQQGSMTWVLDVPTLEHRASVYVGIDLLTSETPRRVIFSASTSAQRTLTGQFWIRDMPEDAVVYNGQQTTESEPLLIVIPIDGTIVGNWAVSFFPSFNDEVGRQHGSGVTALVGNIVKPYAGAKMVEVFRIIGGVPILWLPHEGRAATTGEETEFDVETVNRHVFSPSVTEELHTYRYDFRALRASAVIARAFGFVVFVDCLPDPIMTATPTQGPIIVHQGFPGIPPQGGPGGRIIFNVTELGDSGVMKVVLTGYKGAVAEVAGVAVPHGTIVVGTEETVVYSTTGIKEHILTTTMADATMIVAEAIDSTTTATLGNSIVLRMDLDDDGVPTAPVISVPAYNFSTDDFTVNLNSLGFKGETVTIRAKSLDGAIKDGSSAAQDATDLSAAVGGVEKTTTVTATGSLTWANVFGTIPKAAVFTLENQFGRSLTILVDDEGAVDYATVKQGPVIKLSSLESDVATNDTLRITLSNTGGNVGTMEVRYTIYDNVNNIPTAEGVAQSEISPILTAQDVLVEAGHEDINGHYHVRIEGEQGFSEAKNINNIGGAQHLP